MDFEPIAVEPTFDAFSETFGGGGKLSKFIDKIDPGLLNADYYFPADDVVAELKTMEADAFHPDTLGKRIIASVEKSGHTFAEYLDWLKHGKPFPVPVQRRLNGMITRPIRECIRKALKQISETRKILNRHDARGLVLLANSGNSGLPPNQVMSIAAHEFEHAADRQRDSLVYFTPNVLHRIADDTVGYELWVPVVNFGNQSLQDFIDALGAAWFDYCEQLRPAAVRRTSSDLSKLLDAKTTADRPSEGQKQK